MRTGHYLLLVATIIFNGCGNHKKSSSQSIIVEASVDTVCSLDKCVYPIQIERVGDYLIILDVGNQTQRLSAYSLDGELVHRFGDVGKAANEVNGISHFFRMDDNTISVHKPGGVLYYRLDSLNESIVKYEYKRFAQTPVSVHDMYADGNGVFCLLNSSNERFSYICNDGQVLVYKSYPDACVDNPNDQQAVFNYAPRYDIDMIKKRFCIGTYIGGILETFKISSSGIEPCGMNKLFKSRYTKFDNGAVSWNDESQIGFDDISAEPDHIYTLLSGAKGKSLLKGEQASFADKITVFNWDATINSEIHIGHNMLSMCVSEERNELYAICYKQGESFYLIHATW